MNDLIEYLTDKLKYSLSSIRLTSEKRRIKKFELINTHTYRYIKNNPELPPENYDGVIKYLRKDLDKLMSKLSAEDRAYEMFIGPTIRNATIERVALYLPEEWHCLSVLGQAYPTESMLIDWFKKSIENPKLYKDLARDPSLMMPTPDYDEFYALVQMQMILKRKNLCNVDLLSVIIDNKTLSLEQKIVAWNNLEKKLQDNPFGFYEKDEYNKRRAEYLAKFSIKEQLIGMGLYGHYNLAFYGTNDNIKLMLNNIKDNPVKVQELYDEIKELYEPKNKSMFCSIAGFEQNISNKFISLLSQTMLKEYPQISEPLIKMIESNPKFFSKTAKWFSNYLIEETLAGNNNSLMRDIFDSDLLKNTESDFFRILYTIANEKNYNADNISTLSTWLSKIIESNKLSEALESLSESNIKETVSFDKVKEPLMQIYYNLSESQQVLLIKQLGSINFAQKTDSHAFLLHQWQHELLQAQTLFKMTQSPVLKSKPMSAL